MKCCIFGDKYKKSTYRRSCLKEEINFLDEHYLLNLITQDETVKTAETDGVTEPQHFGARVMFQAFSPSFTQSDVSEDEREKLIILKMRF